MKQTLTATLPDGRTVTRTTARPYTHVVVGHDGDGDWGAFGWCGSHDLAMKKRDSERKWHSQRYPEGAIDIIPVNNDNA